MRETEMKNTNLLKLTMKPIARCGPIAAVLLAVLSITTTAWSKEKKPNILVIWGDDIGHDNISAHHRGMLGSRTPNIDRIAKEGALFTDYYGQASCTEGWANFMLGQNPFRTGLLTIGMPGAKHGVRDIDPTIAELLKPYGYYCGQFGKNHLGDRNEYLPTVHGRKRSWSFRVSIGAISTLSGWLRSSGSCSIITRANSGFPPPAYGLPIGLEGVQ